MFVVNMSSSVKKMCVWLMVASCLVAAATAAGNEYLPPNKGYNYEPPSIPFPTNSNSHKHEEEHHDHHDHHHHEPGMPFDFAYNVNDEGNDYSHNAVSDGDVTRGEYRVALPDGRTQLVRYTADWKTGFHAEVSYEGQAHYPDQPSGVFAGGASSGARSFPPKGY